MLIVENKGMKSGAQASKKATLLPAAIYAV